jgi:hypothetical protein
MKKKKILPIKKSISVYISYLKLKLILKIIGYRKFDYKGVTQIKLKVKIEKNEKCNF